MITDPIANGLTIIRNAARAKKTSVTLPVSHIMESIMAILQQGGYLDNVKTFHDGKKKFARVHLKYGVGNAVPFRTLRRISKPGLRRYVPVTAIPRVLNGMGMSILSTSKGVMSDSQARAARVGGELLCEVW